MNDQSKSPPPPPAPPEQADNECPNCKGWKEAFYREERRATQYHNANLPECGHPASCLRNGPNGARCLMCDLGAKIKDLEERLVIPSSGVDEARRRVVVRHGFYVASRASIPEMGRMWRGFRSMGVPINSTWIDEDGEGQTDDFVELWQRIVREIQRSSAMILYAEPHHFPLKGALVEVGIALACGIPIGVVLPGIELEPRSCRPVGSWVNHPQVKRFRTVNEAVDALAEAEKGVRK